MECTIDRTRRLHVEDELCLESMIKQVYGGGGSQPLGEHGHLLLDSLNLDNIDEYIDKELRKAVQVAEMSMSSNENKGIIGPDKVIFDVSSNVGSLVIDRDRLGLSSQSNFSSIRANCCVYKGKWQYELMLGSKGVMQVGWATINCKFSQEKGVGDTTHSYAYDGHRVRKWNVSTYKYGESWLTGDVIGCSIDLDKGVIGFYRNGSYLGDAFDNVQVGPGLAYFPAVSLAYNENLVANFGSTPLRYPILGYYPLQQYPKKDVVQTNKLLIWLEKLLDIYYLVTQESNPVLVVRNWPPQYKQGLKAQLLLVAAPLMHRLSPLLANAFLTEGCLIPFLFNLYNKDQGSMDPKSRTTSILEIMWSLMEPHELNQCLEFIVVALLTGYRFAPATPEYHEQKKYLALTLALLQHTPTKHYLLQNILFDKIKFPVFLEVKPLDNTGLAEVVPEVWLDFKQEMNEEEMFRKACYQKSCTHLKLVVKEVELVQLEILLELFDASNVHQGQCSRCIFLLKLREFLKENSGGARVPVVHLCPLPVALAFFHRLISLLRICVSASGIDLNGLSVPCSTFYDNSIPYLEVQRIGGLQSHLLRIYQDIVLQEISRETASSENVQNDLGKLLKYEKKSQHLKHAGDKDNFGTLIELLDGIVRLYHIAAHRQLEKMCALRDSMHEYRHALKEIEKRLKVQKGDVEDELKLAKNVFMEELIEQGRHQAWISSVVYSSDRQADVYWLLQILLRTLSQASETGVLFSFVPDFYVEACIKCCHALRNFFPPAAPADSLPAFAGHHELLIKYGSFLAHHFADERVVNAELKDSLVQALASYVCYPATLQALESMDSESRLTMTKALLQPYENRAWAQSNWILIRLWKGCGFAFRYSVSPHLAKKMSCKSIPLPEAFPTISQTPCPSPVFLEHASQWLLENPESASSFMSSVLNQLNWAFSEFIGMLQEIQNASNRPERVFIDSRQLKICATCFDLALGLLRVLEMTVHLVPQLFTDPNRPSSDIFLTRLCQLVCQVLNRVTSKSGCFCLVASMEIPGLETIDHFPILTAVTGILVSLIIDGLPKSQKKAINALLSEPSFQPSSLDFLLGSTQETPNFKPFSLRDYKEVSKEEIEKVENLIQLLHAKYDIAQQNRGLEEIDDDLVCTICYANPKSARFHPCQHQSCRSCISLHLLSHKECFFCKATIEYVKPLHPEKK
ncbi:LOW QUALITY PROTEIN: E3 ubiquitin-protein ligase RNF123-like [Uloborus diversus]|uniref:LOW QUALITY PROTEIN: E3 ubiquitin-protein ligase RNF123-like n=2 Tax=Uloborus diversus TaxID=327109 RepID=UPI002409FAFB|nr:LOW QUALITY PROTEIN: E3 ubiquitin-protein ligase RNF123-like [Uloborus diversus]